VEKSEDANLLRKNKSVMNLHALAKTGHEWSLEHTMPLPLWKENESSSRRFALQMQVMMLLYKPL
jgi:hypothetical protein